MKKLLFILLFVLSAVSVSAFCSEGQIDINSASLNELDGLYGIGPAKAQAIIDYRTQKSFESVDDLINVNGIGGVTLNNIKAQGLACVENSEENMNENTDENIIENSSISSEQIESGSTESENKEFEDIRDSEPLTFEAIDLNPKDIKTAESFESSDKDYAVYGLLAFSVLLGFLFLSKIIRNKKYKNEFD